MPTLEVMRRMNHSSENWTCSRRDCLRLGMGAALTGMSGWPAFAQGDSRWTPKLVAGVVSVYHHNSHADVILGKVLARWSRRIRIGARTESRAWRLYDGRRRKMTIKEDVNRSHQQQLW